MALQHVTAKKEVYALLQDMAECRDNDCLVPTNHPFYWSEEAVAPLVPTYVNTGDIMMIAAYPTAAFANFEDLKIRNVPSFDIFEVLADTRYFDGEGIRDVRAGTVFRLCYLDPLGIRRSRLWLTNTVKCFLFDKGQSDRHAKLPLLKPIRILPARENFFKCANPCVKNWLMRELKLAVPKIVFTIGSEAAEVVHGYYGNAPAGFFKNLVGVPLKAGEKANASDRRIPEFADKHVFHFIHPGFIMREPKAPLTKAHWDLHLPAAFKFLRDLKISVDRPAAGTLTDDVKAELFLAKSSAPEIDHGADI